MAIFNITKQDMGRALQREIKRQAEYSAGLTLTLEMDTLPMTRNAITLAVHAAIHEYLDTDHTLTDDTNLADNLGIDSLDATAIVISLEGHLNVSVPEGDEVIFEGTIGEIVTYLEGLINVK